MKFNQDDLNRLIEMAWEDRTPFDAIKKQFSGQILQNIPITSIKRSSEGVDLYCESEEPRRFDDVVIATLADEAYQLLADPSVEEKKIVICLDIF